MARDFDPSASQQRAIALFGLTFDGTHAGAKAVLSAAGLTENGIPNGLTPVAARKLSDDELRAAFGVATVDASTASATGIAAVQAHRDERAADRLRWQEIHRARRDAENARIRAIQYGEYVPSDSREDVREELAEVAARSPEDHDIGQRRLREDY
jgi:hypothetical protein